MASLKVFNWDHFNRNIHQCFTEKLIFENCFRYADNFKVQKYCLQQKESDNATASTKNWFPSNLKGLNAEKCFLVIFKNELEGQIAGNTHENKTKHNAYYPNLFSEFYCI